MLKPVQRITIVKKISMDMFDRCLKPVSLQQVKAARFFAERCSKKQKHER